MIDNNYSSNDDYYPSWQDRVYKLEQAFFNSYKYIYLLVFLCLPIAANIIFNAFFGFNPEQSFNNDETSFSSAYLLVTVVIFIIQLVVLIYLNYKMKIFFVKSGAILLAFFAVGFFIIQIIVSIFGGFVVNRDSNNADTILSIVSVGAQDLFYIGLIIYFFKQCLYSKSNFFRGFISYRKIKNKEDLMVFIKPWAVMAIGFLMFLIYYLIIYLVLNTSDGGGSDSGGSQNQQGINEILETTVGKIFIIPLIVILAPITEELVTRQSPIFSLISDSDITESNYKQKLKSYNVFKIKKWSRDKILWLVVSCFFSFVFFANMHVQYANIGDIVLYIFPSLFLTSIFVFADFSAAVSICVHAVTNLITLIFILS